MSQFNANQSMQLQSARPDGRAVVREASTYMSDPDAQQFCEFFAEGLDSGLGYARIINFLERKGTRAAVIQSLRNALLEQGTQLSEAFARYGLLDASARKLILVAEMQGTLPELLKLQAKIYRDRYERKKEVVFGAIEPMILALFAFCGLMPIVSNMMLLFNSTESIPVAVMRVILGPVIIGLFAAFGYMALSYTWLSLPVDMPSRETGARIMMRIPGISIPARYFSMSVFCRYFYTSTRSGLNIYEGLYLAAEACNNPMVFEGIPKALEKIEQGVSLEQSLAGISAIPRDVVDYIGMGEETGRLEEMLLKCADIYKERAEQAFKKAMSATIYVFRLALVIGVLIAAFSGLVDKIAIFNNLFN